MHESPLASEIAIALNLVLDQGKTLVYQHCNVHDVKNSKLIGTTWLCLFRFKFKVEQKVAAI